MNITKYFILILILFFNSCISQKNNQILDIERQLSKNFIEKNSEIKIDETESFIAIYPVHNKIESNKINEGIYRYFNKINSNQNFFIYKNKKVEILEISTTEDLLKSIEKVIQYSIEKKYCNDIIKDYITRMVVIHSTINNNRRRRDLNCKFEQLSLKSNFIHNEIAEKLIKYLISDNQTKKNNVFDESSEVLVFRKLDMYYGLPNENEKLDIGVYLFLNSEKGLKPNYIFINENDYEILGVTEKPINIINKAIQFCENNKICHEKTNLIISDIIDFSIDTNCLKTFVISDVQDFKND